MNINSGMLGMSIEFKTIVIIQLQNYYNLWSFLPGVSYSMIILYTVQKRHESKEIVFLINHKLYLLF